MTAAILAEFERCRPWLVEALRIDQENTPDELLTELLTGRAMLWPAERGCIVTRCALTERGPEIHAWLGAGELRELVALRPGIEAFGRIMGCAWATINGRKGWRRLYEPFGYVAEPDGVLRKAL